MQVFIPTSPGTGRHRAGDPPAMRRWSSSAPDGTAVSRCPPMGNRQYDRLADDGRSFCHHRAISTSSPMRLVLFDVDGASARPAKEECEALL